MAQGATDPRKKTEGSLSMPWEEEVEGLGRGPEVMPWVILGLHLGDTIGIYRVT